MIHGQRFNAGLVVGANLSQLDGDMHQGYNKIGIQMGARASVIFTDRFDVSTGLMYTQKGSIFESRNVKEKIKLNYMEVPILINYRSNYFKEKKYYRWQWFTGVSVSRLISSSVDENKNDDFDFTAINDFLQSTEFSHVIGVNYYFNRHLALGLQNSIAITKAYDAKDDPIEGNDIRILRNYLLNFRLLYMLW